MQKPIRKHLVYINFWISLISFIVCIGVSHIFAKSKPFSFLITRNSRFETLDGLRGFLALSVFFHHFVITYYWKVDGLWQRPPEDYYENYGKVGVGMFFMITGFLFVSKLLKSNGDISWLKFYESRFFRIFPLYIFAVICITYFAFSYYDFSVNSSAGSLLKQYLKWGLFIGGAINEFEYTKNVIAGVDWTLKYEWLFYFCLPVISLVIFRGKFPAVILVVIACVFLFIKPYYFSYFTTEYFILFAIGGVSSWVSLKFFNENNILRTGVYSSVSVLLVAVVLFYPKTFDAAHIAIISLLFMLVAGGCDMFGLLRSASAILLGEISYSIYLLHGLILYVVLTYVPVVNVESLDLMNYSLLMPAIAMLVIIFSCATYLLIEKPFVEIGKKYKLEKAIIFVTSNAKKAWLRIIH